MSTIPALQLEVAGPFAMFARPDTGSTPISYPLPTWSAPKRMFETAARLRSACVIPTRAEIRRQIGDERHAARFKRERTTTPLTQGV